MTPWTVAHQAPLSMEFSRQEYWSGLPFPTPEDLSNPGIEPLSSASPALTGRFFITETPGKPSRIDKHNLNKVNQMIFQHCDWSETYDYCFVLLY